MNSGRAKKIRKLIGYDIRADRDNNSRGFVPSAETLALRKKYKQLKRSKHSQ